MGSSPETLYVTYCSRKKREDEGLLPSVQRYTGQHIRDICDMAALHGADFRILSGRFGLVKGEDPLPNYDHLLQDDEVADLVKKVSDTLRELNIEKITYFTEPVDAEPRLRPYLNAITTACAQEGISLVLETLGK